MRIGVLDTDGVFQNPFFADKKLRIVRKEKWDDHDFNKDLPTHSEIVCSHIFREAPEAEILLITIINKRLLCTVQALIDGINQLIKEKVDIINLSIGDEYHNHEELEMVCKRACEQGILLIAAYSNRGNVNTFPASFPFVLGVKCRNEKSPEQIIRYDIKKNDICFTTSYFSLYHLGVPWLLSGNSFACAKICGILSHNTQKYKLWFRHLEGSDLNKYYPYKKLKSSRCLFLSNRLDEPMEQRFIKEVTNTVMMFDVRKFFDNYEVRCRQKKIYDILIVDCDSYELLLKYKGIIKRLCIERKNTEVVFRYPLYSLYEIMELQNQGIEIQQLLI